MNDIKSHGEKAVELYLSGYSCAQSVFAAFSDVTGIDEKTALKSVSALGGGISGMREVCGTVTGMALVLGSVRGYNRADDYEGKKRVYAEVRALSEKFKEKHNTIICRELLHGIRYGSVPMVRNEEYYKTRPCAGYIETMANLLDEFIREKSNEN